MIRWDLQMFLKVKRFKHGETADEVMKRSVCGRLSDGRRESTVLPSSESMYLDTQAPTVTVAPIGSRSMPPRVALPSVQTDHNVVASRSGRCKSIYNIAGSTPHENAAAKLKLVGDSGGPPLNLVRSQRQTITHKASGGCVLSRTFVLS